MLNDKNLKYQAAIIHKMPSLASDVYKAHKIHKLHTEQTDDQGNY